MKGTYSRKKIPPLAPPIFADITEDIPAVDSEGESTEHLKEKLQKLHYLCSNYDPYQKDIPEEIHQLLLEFQLDPKEHNPFSLTENLLVLLDQLTNLAKKIS